MLDAAQAIQRFTAGKSEQDLADDDQLLSAVSWRVIVLGEAARRINREFRDAASEIDWKALLTERNFFAHDYDLMTARDLWRFVQTQVAVVVAVVPGLLSPLED